MCIIVFTVNKIDTTLIWKVCTVDDSGVGTATASKTILTLSEYHEIHSLYALP